VHHEGAQGKWGIYPLIPNFSSKWCDGQLHTPATNRGQGAPPLNWNLGATRTQYGRLGKNKCFLQLPEIELRYIDH